MRGVKRSEFPSHKEVRKLFVYDDGQLFWQERKYLDDFASERSRRSWNAKHANKSAGTIVKILQSNKITYRNAINYKKQEYFRSILVWIYFNTGSIPDDKYIDHINHDTLDDRIENLRLASRSQNTQNGEKYLLKELPKGVSKNGNRYRSRITVNGKLITIGNYKTYEEAHQAYIDAAKHYFGEFACAG